MDSSSARIVTLWANPKARVGGKGNTGGDVDTDPVLVFKLVAYRGNILQVNYDGAFIYAQIP